MHVMSLAFESIGAVGSFLSPNARFLYVHGTLEFLDIHGKILL